MNVPREVRVALAGPLEDLAQLGLDQLDRLARDRPPLGLDDAVSGIARELLATLDQRDVHAPASEVPVGRARTQATVELLDADEDAAHLRDRVDAEMRARAVRCASDGLERDVHEPAVRHRELELRRLGDDRGVGREARRDRLRSHARELLVGDGGEDHVAAQPPPRRLCGCEHAGGQAPLHVVGATSVEPTAFDAGARTAQSSPRRRPCRCERSGGAWSRCPAPVRRRRRWGVPAWGPRGSSRALRARTSRRRNARSRPPPSRRARRRG